MSLSPEERDAKASGILAKLTSAADDLDALRQQIKDVGITEFDYCAGKLWAAHVHLDQAIAELKNVLGSCP